MRLPLAGNISTKDGASNKNARMVNVLAEEKKDKTIAAVRPGLNQVGTTTGVGNGLVCFNGALISIYDANMGYWHVDPNIQSPVDIGTLGGAYGKSYAASNDGSVIVGESSAASLQSFRWTEAGGMVNIGGSSAAGVSGDGNIVVGSNALRAYRWTEAGGMVNIWSSRSQAYGISNDGLVIVGYAWNGSQNNAFRWTSGGGMVDLGTLGGVASIATGVSEDGSFVVGSALTSGGVWHAFVWTSGSGMVYIGTLGGSDSEAEAISLDGSVVVGYARNGSGDARAFRWTSSGGMEDLGTLGGNTSIAYGISGDGSLIVGYSNNGTYDRGFIWSSFSGSMQEAETLGGNGSACYAISNDGTTLVGQAQTSGAEYHATYWQSEGTYALTGLTTVENDSHDFALIP